MTLVNIHSIFQCIANFSPCDHHLLIDKHSGERALHFVWAQIFSIPVRGVARQYLKIVMVSGTMSEIFRSLRWKLCPGYAFEVNTKSLTYNNFVIWQMERWSPFKKFYESKHIFTRLTAYCKPLRKMLRTWDSYLRTSEVCHHLIKPQGLFHDKTITKKRLLTKK